MCRELQLLIGLLDVSFLECVYVSGITIIDRLT
jgi:hypothetical protein